MSGDPRPIQGHGSASLSHARILVPQWAERHPAVFLTINYGIWPEPITQHCKMPFTYNTFVKKTRAENAIVSDGRSLAREGLVLLPSLGFVETISDGYAD